MKCRGERAYLILEDGTILDGCSFGAETHAVGEVVFTTTMYGYPEALTDPSYKGQILVMTHPMVGNYGVPDPNIIDPKSGLPLHYESDGVKVEAFVIARLTKPNHWASVKDLDQWLKEEGIPGIYGIDTRMLVKKLREEGVKMGILYNGEDLDEAIEMLRNAPRYDEVDYVSKVKPKHVVEHGEGPLVVLLDCGVKYGIVRELVSRGFKVLRVPCGYNADKYLSLAKGVVLANGPGNPKVIMKRYKVDHFINSVLEYKLPIMAICLGHQMLNMTLGADVYKMKYGHRGVNKPVREVKDKKCYIVSENHGFAIDIETINKELLEPWFINPDDGTLEGVKGKEMPILSTQFHPESSPGPNDTKWIFDQFAKVVA